MSTKQQKKVVIYSTPTCHFCHMAKEFFEENGIVYKNYDVSLDLEKRQEMINLTGQMGVPVILIDGEVIVGFDEDRIREELGMD